MGPVSVSVSNLVIRFKRALGRTVKESIARGAARAVGAVLVPTEPIESALVDASSPWNETTFRLASIPSAERCDYCGRLRGTGATTCAGCGAPA